MASKFSHKLPEEHLYEGILFFGFSPPETLDAVKDFQVRDDDVFIMTYPKAVMFLINSKGVQHWPKGTTWLQEIVWLIMHDGDFRSAAKDPVYFRCPFLEFKDDVLHEVGLDIANSMPSPRVIKSHLAVKLMPRQLFQNHRGKILLLFRNPKDICVSYYHFYRSSSSLGNFIGPFHEFLHMFVEGHVDHGSWFDFTRSWWSKRHEANVYILFYEDMQRDLKQCIIRLCEFLNKPLSDNLVDRIVEHSSFESMSMNPMTNHLDVYSINSKISPQLRKGIVGDWKSHFTVGQNELFDKIYEEKMGDLNIPFLYELE